MLHLLLHALVPGLVARAAWPALWRRAWLVMLGTMVVDVDHLLADPIYDPARCSLGFHPLHTPPALVVWTALLALPPTRMVGAGLVVHMALDGIDCITGS